MNKRQIFFTIFAAMSALLFLGQIMVKAAEPNAPLPAKCLGTNDATYECLDSSNPNGPAYQFQDIAGNHPPLVFGNNDDGVTHLTMPFDFTFYDVTSDILTVSMNGAIKFGSHINSINAFNAGLSVAPTYFIAPLWDDIDNSPGVGGGVYTDVVGIAPNRQFIIQWERIPHYNNLGDSTFQVIFYEGSNELLFQYEDLLYGNSNFDYGASATVGIKGSSSNVQYAYNYAQYWETAAITNSTAVRFFTTADAFPQAATESYQISRGQQLTVLPADGVLANDTAPFGRNLRAGLYADVAHGTLNLLSDGSFTYQPDADFAGGDSFIYYNNDSTSNSNGVEVGIWVQNTAPTAVSDSYTTTQVSPVVMSAPGVLANDNDADGDAVTAVLDNTTAHGSLTLNTDGSFTYTPTSGFKGTDSFTYHVNDGVDDSTTTTVVLTVENVAPTAAADAYTTTLTQPLTVSTASGVLENDGDAGGDAVTAVLDNTTVHGSLTLNSDGSFSYTADYGYAGADSFTYHATDGTDNSNTVTVNISVEGSYIYLPMIVR